MKVDTKRFKEFYERVRDTFPYNNIRVTRNRFHTKWLLMRCKTNPGILFYHKKYYPLLCTTLEADIVQQIIITEQGIPLPHDISVLMDCMFHWGRSLSGPWYDKTLELINFYVNCSDLNGSTFCATQLYFDVIQMRVVHLISDHFAHGNTFITEGWMAHYRSLIERGTTDFFELAVSSFQYTKAAIEELEYDSDSVSGMESTEHNDIDSPSVVES